MGFLIITLLIFYSRTSSHDHSAGTLCYGLVDKNNPNPNSQGNFERMWRADEVSGRQQMQWWRH